VTEGKRQKPLGLDMDFGEALERFAGVDPAELPERIRLGKKAKPIKKGSGPEEPPPKKPPKRLSP
jgi:hypothetical protein